MDRTMLFTGKLPSETTSAQNRTTKKDTEETINSPGNGSKEIPGDESKSLPGNRSNDDLRSLDDNENERSEGIELRDPYTNFFSIENKRQIYLNEVI